MVSEQKLKKFITMLNGLGGTSGNKRLMHELGWADLTYDKVKAHLLESGEIVVRRGGRGGTIYAKTVEPQLAAVDCVSNDDTETEVLKDKVRELQVQVDRYEASSKEFKALAFEQITVWVRVEQVQHASRLISGYNKLKEQNRDLLKRVIEAGQRDGKPLPEVRAERNDLKTKVVQLECKVALITKKNSDDHAQIVKQTTAIQKYINENKELKTENEALKARNPNANEYREVPRGEANGLN